MTITQTRFGDLLAEPLRNGVYKPKQYHGRGVKVINMKELFAFERIDDQAIDRVYLEPDELARVRLQTGDLLFARRSFVLEGAGKCSIIGNLSEDTTFESSMIRARLDTEKALPRFIYYLFRSPIGRTAVASIATRTAVSGITGKNLQELMIPLLPLSDQQKVVAVLSAYDDSIDNNNRRIKILEEMARRIYQEWFVDFRYPGHADVPLMNSEAGPIPIGWRAMTLGDVAIVNWGDTSTTKAKYVESGFPAYSASGMDGFLPYFDHDHDGIVLSAIGAKCGKTWFASGNWSCIKNTIWFRPRAASMPTEYLYLATSMPNYWPRRGSAQPFVALGDARRARVVMPSNDLLKAFGDIASTMIKCLTILMAASENLRASRDLLLTRLISGEIDVTDLDISLPEAAP